MSERTATEFLNLRLPLYAYTAPLWQGRRVLEIGCGDGGSAEYLGSHGAERVLSVDTDAGRVDRARARHSRARVDFRAVSDLRQIATIGAPGERIDVVLAPEGQLLLATPALITDIRRLLGDTGHLIAAVPAADRKGRMAKDGVGYYDLADALAERFPVLRMLGQTPFLGFGLVEFDGSADALRVDVSLLQSGAEQPSHYVGIAGAAAPPSLGYSLVQVPFAPVEAVIFGAEAGASGALPIPAREAAPSVSDARLEMAERRLEESERRARARLEEAETRLSDLRRKLEEALVQAESSVRVSRAQAEEIQELRARIRRGSEDRAAADDELSKLRRALAQADESVLTLTRRTAEEMAVVAEKMVTGLGRGNASAISAGVAGDSAAKSGANAAAEQAERAELEERARRAEAAASRDHAEIATLTERIRVADEQIRALKQKSAAVAERDDRIARLEGDKQDLLWRVAELEEKLRHAAADAAGRGQQQAHPNQLGARDDQGTAQQVAAARQARDRAIEELHRAAAAHANEVHQLRSSVAEQAALVAELEDAVRVAEARAGAADKEATTLRRNAKELEEADRTRRGRLAELEGKLLRLERERSLAAASGGGGGGTGTDDGALADLKQRLAATEQRAVVAEQRVTAAEERAQAQAKAMSAPGAAGANNGHPGAGTPTGLSAPEVEATVAGIEERLREEMRALAVIEETLARAREDASRAFPAASEAGGELNMNLRAYAQGDARDDLERALAAKDSQLVEGRLELARLRRDSEARQAQLEREISDLRARLNPSGEAGMSDDHSQSAQLILMHSTLGNIRRRSARLRDELEGFRRRLDTLPPGALSSMLEEIGEDLAEFAK